MIKNTLRCNQQHVLSSIFIASFALHLSSSVVGAETRYHDSHVHGTGVLNIAQDGNAIFIELKSPVANIVGFEHAPKNEEQEEALHKATHLLQKGDELFTFTANAQCTLQDVHLERADDHHDEHDGEHHDEEGEHSDIEIAYQFSCAQPQEVKTIEVNVFSHFPGFTEIDVQLITPNRQTALELSPTINTISL